MLPFPAVQTLLPPPLPPLADPPAAQAYHRVDTRRLTWLECWRVGRSPLKVLILWLGKLAGLEPASAGGFPSPRPLAENLLAPGEVPRANAGPLEALRRECEPLGFAEPLYHHQRNSLAGIDSAGCLLREPKGETLAVLAHARAQSGLGKELPARGVFISLLADGCLLASSNSPALFNAPPGNDIARRIGAPLAAVHSLHGRRLEAHRARGNPPRPVRTYAEVAALYEHNERRAYDFNVARGVYVPLTAEEVAGRQELSAAKQLAVGSAADPLEAEETRAVLEALHRRERPTASSNARGILLLVVSLAVFAVVGWLRWNFSLAMTVVGVLLFHEAGHYLAMRWFGFRNLRMFFVPFFGAVVTGLDPRAPGWKRAVVALAGPLPGLLLAVVVMSGQRWLPLEVRLSPGNLLAIKTAVTALWINGFNLLPLLPLDGGRVLQETLFCRHPLLRAGFAGLAGAGLLALGLQGANHLLGVLGIFMLAGIGSTWRVGQAMRALQTSGAELTPSRPEEIVRPEAVPAVLAALKHSRRSAPRRATLVNEAVAVLDGLRARPPRAGATVLLLAAYAVAWVLALGPLWPLLGSHTPRHAPARPPRIYTPAAPTPGAA